MNEEKIPVYRANPKNRYGATDRMETLPTMFDKATVSSFTRAAAAGQKHGVPVLPPEMIANLMLHEGREDAGFNELNHKNKKAVAIAEKLLEDGHTDEAAGFAAAAGFRAAAFASRASSARAPARMPTIELFPSWHAYS